VRNTESRDPHDLLPLKPVVFQIALVLTEGEKHGWNIVKEVEARMAGTKKILPANLYRTLRNMLADGMIEESDNRPDPELDDERRRYFLLTEFGEAVTRAEAQRMADLVARASAKNLVSLPRG
jgi:DNA-binding PadR family transcriptional regulator